MPSAAATPTMWRRPAEATPTTLSVHAERAPLAASRASLPATTPPWQESPETALDASRRGGGCQRAGGEGRERQTEENESTREQAAPRGELMKKRRAALKN